MPGDNIHAIRLLCALQGRNDITDDGVVRDAPRFCRRLQITGHCHHHLPVGLGCEGLHLRCDPVSGSPNAPDRVGLVRACVACTEGDKLFDDGLDAIRVYLAEDGDELGVRLLRLKRLSWTGRPCAEVVDRLRKGWGIKS